MFGSILMNSISLVKSHENETMKSEVFLPGKTDVWESVDREQEKILIAKEAGEVLAEEKRQNAKLSGTAPACAAMKAVGGNPKALFDRIDEDGSGLLEYDEISGHLR